MYLYIDTLVPTSCEQPFPFHANSKNNTIMGLYGFHKDIIPPDLEKAKKKANEWWNYLVNPQQVLYIKALAIW